MLDFKREVKARRSKAGDGVVEKCVTRAAPERVIGEEPISDRQWTHLWCVMDPKRNAIVTLKRDPSTPEYKGDPYSRVDD